MVKSVQLRKEDCYCDLTKFYENVARKIPAEITDKTCFDCRKICVTKSVQEALWSYYRDEKKRPTSRLLRCCWDTGRRPNLEEHGILEYRAEVEDGFIVCEEG